MFRTRLTAAALVALVLLLPACTAKLFVDSNPRGAEIYVDGIPAGAVTPRVIRVDPGDRKVTVVVPEYGASEPGTVTVTKSTSRIVLSCILPIPMAIIYLFKGWSVAEPVRLTLDAPGPGK